MGVEVVGEEEVGLVIAVAEMVTWLGIVLMIAVVAVVLVTVVVDMMDIKVGGRKGEEAGAGQGVVVGVIEARARLGDAEIGVVVIPEAVEIKVLKEKGAVKREKGAVKREGKVLEEKEAAIREGTVEAEAGARSGTSEDHYKLGPFVLNFTLTTLY